MTKRPLLIFNGKPKRYKVLHVTMCAIGYTFDDETPQVEVDNWYYDNCRVSFGRRPSGRRVIWVSAEVANGLD